MIQCETLAAPTEVLLNPRGRVTQLARELRVPVGTVWSWKQKQAIPAWRRPAVLTSAHRLGLELPAHVLVYLAQAAE